MNCCRPLAFRQPVEKKSSGSLDLKLTSHRLSVVNKSPFQDSSHPDDHFQSRYVTPGFKTFSYKEVSSVIT